MSLMFSYDYLVTLTLHWCIWVQWILGIHDIPNVIKEDINECDGITTPNKCIRIIPLIPLQMSPPNCQENMMF